MITLCTETDRQEEEQSKKLDQRLTVEHKILVRRLQRDEESISKLSLPEVEKVFHDHLARRRRISDTANLRLRQARLTKRG